MVLCCCPGQVVIQLQTRERSDFLSEGIAGSRLSGHLCKQLENLAIRFELQTWLIILRQQSKRQKTDGDLQSLMEKVITDWLIRICSCG